jgi:tRNA dimethylallyltransferase
MPHPPPLPPAILLLGPTASGKTALVLDLAQRLPLEVVSVDSAQVYRGMDIGTAKPSPAERLRCPHHLIDILTPEESYSAARFRADALRLMRDITARGRIPLLAGGTMLYFKALREGLSDLPEADPALRREIDEQARSRGWPALHAELARLDPQAAARFKPTDAQRIQRALEIVRLTGRPLAASHAMKANVALPFRLAGVALMPSNRTLLHQRIAQRFDAMLAQGLVDEVEQLARRYRLSPELPSMRSVGYRQVWQYLAGRGDFDAMRMAGIVATRQLAKRQLTWLRGMTGFEVVDCVAGDPAGRVRQVIEASLA